MENILAPFALRIVGCLLDSDIVDVAKLWSLLIIQSKLR